MCYSNHKPRKTKTGNWDIRKSIAVSSLTLLVVCLIATPGFSVNIQTAENEPTTGTIHVFKGTAKVSGTGGILVESPPEGEVGVLTAELSEEGEGSLTGGGILTLVEPMPLEKFYKYAAKEFPECYKVLKKLPPSEAGPITNHMRMALGFLLSSKDTTFPKKFAIAKKQVANNFRVQLLINEIKKEKDRAKLGKKIIVLQDLVKENVRFQKKQFRLEADAIAKELRGILKALNSWEDNEDMIVRSQLKCYLREALPDGNIGSIHIKKTKKAGRMVDLMETVPEEKKEEK